MDINNLKKEIIKISQLMYVNRFVAANDGNISALLNDGNILTTPSGLSKGMIGEDDLVVVDSSGNKIGGSNKYGPSSELKMHLKVYQLRSDVRAVVHAHPPITTAFSVANIPLSEKILPESIFTLGMIRFVVYATPTTEEVPKAIEKAIPNQDTIVLTRHGSLMVGPNLMDAYLKLESLEHTAKIISESMKISAAAKFTVSSPLPEVEIQRLMAIKDSLRNKSQNSNTSSSPEIEISEEAVAYIISEVVKKLYN